MKTTQEQLAKEKDTVKKLQEQLDKSVSAASLPSVGVGVGGGQRQPDSPLGGTQAQGLILTCTLCCP